MTFTFQIADLPGSSKSVNITLPYGAFDLLLTYGYPNLNVSFNSAGINYFPLRRATNKAQYTLGRAFLQESYLMVDYDRNNFSISQAKFATDALSNVNIISITQPKNSTDSGDKGSSGSLNKGAIAGIIVGVAIGILAIAALVYICLRRRHGKPEPGKTSSEEIKKAELDCPTNGTDDNPLDVFVDHKFPLRESSAEPERTELPGNSPAELPGSAPAELPGSEVASMKDGREISPFRAWRRKQSASRMPPPAHLTQRHWSSSSETATARTGTSAQSDSEPSPVTPAFSPARFGRGGGHSPSDVSPQSSQATTPLFSPLIPSPLTPAFARGDADCHRSGRDGST